MNYSITNISALIVNTFVREYRNKFLHFVSIATILLIVLFQYAQINIGGNVLSGAQTQMYTFYRFIFIWVNIMSAMIGVQVVRNDIEASMLSQVLSFPLSRFEYLLARVLSGWILITAYYVLSVLLFGTMSLLMQGESGFSLQIFYSIFIAAFASLAVVLLGVFIALFLSKIPAFLSTMFLILLIWIAVSYFSSVPDWKQIEWTVLNVSGFLFYAVFPHISVVYKIAEGVINHNFPDINWWFEAFHFFLSLALWFAFTWFVFKRKEI